MIRTPMVPWRDGPIAPPHSPGSSVHHACGRCDATAYLQISSANMPISNASRLRPMLETEQLDALVVATPSKLHAAMVEKALNRGLHVFCEKPFVLDVADGERLVEHSREKGRVTQVSYHYRFVRAFKEGAQIARSGALGTVHHVRAEAYGPVVRRKKGGTWRSAKSEGRLRVVRLRLPRIRSRQFLLPECQPA